MSNDQGREVRDDWGMVFRGVVSSGRTGAAIVLLIDMPFLVRTDGVSQAFFVIVGLVSLVALFPRSPLIPAIVQILPWLPKKGNGG